MVILASTVKIGGVNQAEQSDLQGLSAESIIRVAFVIYKIQAYMIVHDSNYFQSKSFPRPLQLLFREICVDWSLVWIYTCTGTYIVILTKIKGDK